MKPFGITLLVTLLSSATVAADADGQRLIEAAKAGNRQTVRLLVGQRVDVNSSEADGTTALHWAVRADDVELVKLLLAAGAKVNAANRYGVTPLSVGATNANPSTIKVLLEAGANANASLPEGETVLLQSARAGPRDG